MSPTDESQFFEEKRPAAVLKHGILGRYLHPFVSKVGKYAPDHRVVYLDGYAGPGTYTDGSPGSPALAVQTQEKVAAIRDLMCIYVEPNDGEYEELCAMLDEYDNWVAFNEPLEDCLDDVLAEAGASAPLFAFLDPFGLGLPFDQLVSKVLARSDPGGGPATEVLLNFSLPGLRRNAGHLTSDKAYSAKQALVERTDDRLGGDWWHDIWRDEPSGDRERSIVLGYVRHLVAAAGGGWGWWMIPVANRPDGPTVYYLIFLFRHPDGIWTFNNALSSAMHEYEDFCDRMDEVRQTTLELYPRDHREAE